MELIFLKTRDAEAIAAAVSAATSVPGQVEFICVRGRLSVVVSGLSQHLWSTSGSLTFQNMRRKKKQLRSSGFRLIAMRQMQWGFNIERAAVLQGKYKAMHNNPNLSTTSMMYKHKHKDVVCVWKVIVV